MIGGMVAGTVAGDGIILLITQLAAILLAR